MAQVGTAKELPDSPSGSITIGKNGNSEYTRTFLVEYDSPNNGALEAMYATGIPADWSYYAFGSEFNTLSRLYKKSANRRGINPDCSCFWEVVCNYKTHDEEDDDPDDPTQEPIKIEGDFNISQELIQSSYEDSGSEPTEGIRNSAGELFRQQPQREIDNLILRITRNESLATNIPNLAKSFNNKINDANVVVAGVTFLENTLKVRIKFSREQKEVGTGATKSQVRFWKVSYELSHKSQTWLLKLLDHGSYYLDGGIKIPFKTEYGGEPYLGLLDGTSGGESETPKFLDPPLNIFERADFSALNLPATYT